MRVVRNWTRKLFRVEEQGRRKERGGGIKTACLAGGVVDVPFEQLDVDASVNFVDLVPLKMWGAKRRRRYFGNALKRRTGALKRVLGALLAF